MLFCDPDSYPLIEEVIQMEVALGDLVTDTVTRFSGQVTAIITYAHDSPQARIEGMDSNGSPEALWVPYARIEKQKAF